MAITKAWIEEDCIACGLCEGTCSDVFAVNSDIAEVNDGVDLSQFEDEIREAASECPVEVIKFEEA